jgi:hypothetical protein
MATTRTQGWVDRSVCALTGGGGDGSLRITGMSRARVSVAVAIAQPPVVRRQEPGNRGVQRQERDNRSVRSLGTSNSPPPPSRPLAPSTTTNTSSHVPVVRGTVNPASCAAEPDFECAATSEARPWWDEPPPG